MLFGSPVYRITQKKYGVNVAQERTFGRLGTADLCESVPESSMGGAKEGLILPELSFFIPGGWAILTSIVKESNLTGGET